MSQHPVVMDITQYYVGDTVRGAQQAVFAYVDGVVAPHSFFADAINGSTIN